MNKTIDHEVANLLQECHTQTWMKDMLEIVLTDLNSTPDRDISMNDVVSAFVCAMMREKEFFRSEFAIGF
jgi:hypothetical protein